MKALVLTAPSALALTDADLPPLADDGALLRVHACGICGSDIHGWDGSSGRRIPPLIMGHETAGVVVSVGPRVTRCAVGDRVAVDSTLFCGECEECQAGRVNLCTQRRVLGVSTPEYRQHGAFAEFIAVPERVLHPIPDHLPWTHAAMVEPVSIAVHAVGRVTVKPDQVAVVVGAGMIGLLVIQALRWAGAGRIVAVDLEPKRLALARRLGATDTVQSGATDAAGAVAGITGGRGADLTFEVVGIGPTVQLAIELTRRGGTVVLVGNLARQIEFPLQRVVTGELTLRASCGSAGEYPLCIDLIARGVIDVAPLVSDVAPLESGPEWFERLSAPGGSEYLKIILEP